MQQQVARAASIKLVTGENVTTINWQQQQHRWCYSTSKLYRGNNYSAVGQWWWHLQQLTGENSWKLAIRIIKVAINHL